jgi:hypothetical protein
VRRVDEAVADAPDGLEEARAGPSFSRSRFTRVSTVRVLSSLDISHVREELLARLDAPGAP